MSGQKRTTGVLLVLIVGVMFLGCASSPTVTPDVADTATDLTSTADDVSDTIDDATDEAQDIATAAAGTDLEGQTAEHLETMKRLQAERDELNNAVEKSNTLSFCLAGEIEKLRTENLEQETEIAILKGQRLSLLLILGFLFTLFLLYLYARIKNLV